MAAKLFFLLVTVLAYLEFLRASPTRRQLISITESSVSESPVSSDGTVWDDNDEFDLDGDDQDNWFSRAVVLPSAVPDKAQEYAEYDDEENSKINTAIDLGHDDEDDEDQEAEAEEEDEDQDSKFLFMPPRDTRLMLDDDDDDQSGPIKVRHTGRNSYPSVFDGSDNSLESSEDEEEDDGKENDHPYEFTIDEDDKDDEEEDVDDEEDSQKDDDDTAEALNRHDTRDDDNEDDEDDFVSEGEDGDMFDNPEEDAAQVIYGDHVFLY